MKKLITLLLLLPFTGWTQSFDHTIYADFSVDPNKVFNVVDNPHTVKDHTGLDFDLEAGVVSDRFGVYLFYGRFEAAGYQNYGAGFDYHFLERRKVNLAVGIGISRILRKMPAGADYERTAWADVGGWANYHGRVVGVYWLWENLGVSGRFQYQKRDDVENLHGVVEGAVGVRYKWNRH